MIRTHSLKRERWSKTLKSVSNAVRSKRALVALGASMVAVTALALGIWPNFPRGFYRPGASCRGVTTSNHLLGGLLGFSRCRLPMALEIRDQSLTEMAVGLLSCVERQILSKEI